MYARFLGEKSLDLNIRAKFMAVSEFLEFQNAKQAYKSGENAYLYRQVRNAARHYQSCVDILKSIHFYQDFSTIKPIKVSEFNQTQKMAYLQLIKCLLKLRQDFSQYEKYLYSYLEMEDNLPALHELELFLQGEGIIKEKLEIKPGTKHQAMHPIALHIANQQHLPAMLKVID